MGIYKSYYVIAGYDLTNYKTDWYDEWKWTEHGESFLCNARLGNIQLFDDPSNDSFLYFGVVLVKGDQYTFNSAQFDVVDIANAWSDVTDDLLELINCGVIHVDRNDLPEYKVIVFEQCS